MGRNNVIVADNAINVEEEVMNKTAEIIRMSPNIDEVTDKKVLYAFCKRAMDIVGSLFGMVLLIPATMIIYLCKFILNEKGPLFYKQRRIGKNGKQFVLYKYRTMIMNADEKLADYLKENKEAAKEYRKYKKLKNDPRITRIGKFLRKTSLDEFPQFINVLKGDMSLVGPRPYLEREKKDISEKYYNEIIKIKPGITGYWQVNGRSDVDFKDRTYMDTYYIQHRGFLMDIKIIIKTVLKMFKKEGAI